MDLTEERIDLIKSGMKSRGFTKTELAARLGKHKTWITKLYNGSLKSLSDADSAILEDALGIKFPDFRRSDSDPSVVASKLDEAISKNPKLENIVEELLDLTEGRKLPELTEQELVTLGEEVRRICNLPLDAAEIARRMLQAIPGEHEWKDPEKSRGEDES